MSNPLPPPDLHPFDRLHVSDGLLINAERWQLAHAYHRQRQNLHFQSLNQPGIVDGLGVCIIPPPENVASQFRDRRWVQIQPGLAIDVNGNPIVVPEAVNFRIASIPDPQADRHHPKGHGETARNTVTGERGNQTVYLILRYVDPETLERQQGTQVVRETYRIDEKDRPPQANEIELCRIHLSAEFTALEPTKDVLNPTLDSLDLRYRPQICPRSTASIRVAIHNESPLVEGIESLLRSLPGLYPKLQPLPPVIFTDLTPDIQSALSDCAALFTSHTFFQELLQPHAPTLQRYIQNGGSIIVEHPIQDDELGELLVIHQRLSEAIKQISSVQDVADSRIRRSPNPTLGAPASNSEMDRMHGELTQELDEISVVIEEKLALISSVYEPFLHPLDVTLTSWENLPFLHPLRCQPFNFSRLPTFAQQLHKILVGRGFCVILGNITSALQGYLGEPLSRGDLRAAEELGINALYTTWQRHRLTQLQSPSP
ncbi:MAG: hypothetical protein VKL39_09635 [Leptolyngbyaceae bacterium]|nr:hypothetical protein [Leptolyngbyaceae bacterium]